MNEILTALYNRLTSMINDVPVYDHVPDNTDEYPYIQFMQKPITNNDTNTEKGFNVNIDIVSFVNSRGLKELNALNDRIYAALHQWSMSDTTKYSVGFLIEESRQTNVAPDGIERYSVQSVKLWVDEIN